MGTMYNKPSTALRVMDYSQSYINIDTLIEVMTMTQQENGITPTFELRDQYKQIEEEKEKESQEEPKEKKCDKECPKSKNPFAALLLYQPDSDDDEDDFYVCELCTALGRKQKYDPSICDGCTNCESCYQYDMECSGCSYSVFRDGTYYRDKVAESEFLSKGDLETFEAIKEGEVPRKTLKGSWFSVLN